MDEDNLQKALGGCSCSISLWNSVDQDCQAYYLRSQFCIANVSFSRFDNGQNASIVEELEALEL